jgi:hypothetical protein
LYSSSDGDYSSSYYPCLSSLFRSLPEFYLFGNYLDEFLEFLEFLEFIDVTLLLSSELNTIALA